jgi:hypothetical protein
LLTWSARRGPGRGSRPREAAAFRAFSEHGELDPGHRDQLDRAFDALPLTERHEQVIGAAAIATVAPATQALEELLQRG